jgi:hypothetical protein
MPQSAPVRLGWITLLICCTPLLSACRDQLLEDAPWPEDGAVVRDEIEALRAYLDGPAYSRAVSWEEHIVLTYEAVQDRPPSLLEFLLIQGLRNDPGIRRSDVLALALAEDTTISWEKARSFSESKDARDFSTSARTRALATKLASTPEEEIHSVLKMTAGEMIGSIADPGAKAIAETTTPPNETYATYFGYLHAHSHFSLDADPLGTPESAYAFAREAGDLDFFSLTDHAIFLIIWPWDNKWARTREVADAADAPGAFVALWGFEYSNPLLGHVSILNTEDFTHTLRRVRLTSLYNWLADRPEAIAQFNHPGDYNYLGIEFLRFRPNRGATPMMMGMETWNTNAGFEGFFYRGLNIEAPDSPLDEALQQGWKIGALGSQDNHDLDWGTKNDFRTGVLATELTREGIVEAYRERRFYATEDKDLYLDFRCEGYPMGARLKDTPRSFTVTARDDSGDTFQEIRLYRNGLLLDRRAVVGTEVTANFTDLTALTEAYYYVMVTQEDDSSGDGRNDEALSSPIWFLE